MVIVQSRRMGHWVSWLESSNARLTSTELLSRLMEVLRWSVRPSCSYPPSQSLFEKHACNDKELY